MPALLEFLECFNKWVTKSMAQVLDEALNAVEVRQKPSPKGQTGKLPSFVVLSRQATSLPSKVRLAEQFSGQPESS